MWEPQPLVTPWASTACIGITTLENKFIQSIVCMKLFIVLILLEEQCDGLFSSSSPVSGVLISINPQIIVIGR
jgi:hypothetical protein